MCDTKIGELITFVPIGSGVKVASDDSIEYDGCILDDLRKEKKVNNSSVSE